MLGEAEFFMIFLMLIDISSFIVMVFFIKMVYGIYNQYKLTPFLIKIYQVFLAGFYVLLSSISPFLKNYFAALITYSISIVVINIATLSEGIFYHTLRTNVLKKSELIMLSSLIILKAISLIEDPVEIFVYHGLILRKLHLSFLSLAVSYAILAYMTMELILLVLDIWVKPHLKWLGAGLLLFYLLLIVAFQTINLLSKDKTISLLLPHIQTIGILIGFQFLIIVFRKNPRRLILLPVMVRGFLVHTYGGLIIYRETFFRHDERLLGLASSLVGALIGIVSSLEQEKKIGQYRVHQLVRTTIIFYFGKMTIGTIIVNRDNSVLREILGHIVDEFENEVKYIDQGMVTSEEISIMERIIERYRVFFE